MRTLIFCLLPSNNLLKRASFLDFWPELRDLTRPNHLYLSLRLAAAFVTPTLYTYGAIPAHAAPCAVLQIFSMEVMESEEWGIRWPVEVYGFIATRDSVDRNRNLLFSRTRDDPQILTQMVFFLLANSLAAGTDIT